MQIPIKERILFVFITILLLVQSASAMWEGEEQPSTSSVTAKPQQSKYRDQNKRNLDDHSQQTSLEEMGPTLFIPQSPLETDQILNSNDPLTKTFLNSVKLVDPVDVLSIELLINVSVFLEARDLGKMPQLSKKWQVVASTPKLWRHIGLTKYGDYLSQEDLTENPKQKVVQHYLSVLVNMKNEGKEIEEMRRVVSAYKLDSYIPYFKQYVPQEFLNKIIKEVIYGLWHGTGGYQKNLDNARDLERCFIIKQDVEEKLKELKKKPKGNTAKQIAKEIEEFTMGGDVLVTHKQFRGYMAHYTPNGTRVPLAHFDPPTYSHEKSPGAAKTSIERFLVSDIPAVRAVGKYIKALALKHGISKLGYEKDYEEAIKFIKKYHVPY